MYGRGSTGGHADTRMIRTLSAASRLSITGIPLRGQATDITLQRTPRALPQVGFEVVSRFCAASSLLWKEMWKHRGGGGRQDEALCERTSVCISPWC